LYCIVIYNCHDFNLLHFYQSTILGFKYADVDRLNLKIKELNARLKKYITSRQVTMAQWKSRNLITPNDTSKYGSSKFVRDVMSLLNGDNDEKVSICVLLIIHNLLRNNWKNGLL